MKVALFVNNRLGAKAVRWLVRDGHDEVVAVFLHPEHRRKHGDEVLSALDMETDQVLDGSRLAQPEVQDVLRERRPEIGLSVLFDYIIPSPMIETFPRGIVNLHPAWLPFNRGQYPNVWSIVERTPAGVTLHYIDENVDTGDIIAQRKVPVHPTDTGRSLYEKLEQAGLALLREVWPSVRDQTAPRLPQDPTAGTYHRTRDVDAIDRIDLEKEYKGGELIDILRARTFPPYRGAYFLVNGKKVYVRVSLEIEQDGESSHEHG